MPDAHAGSYTCVYSGGTHYTQGQTGPGSANDTAMTATVNGVNYTGWGGGGGGTKGAAASGTITATFTWQPAQNLTLATDPPPAQVVATEASDASVSGLEEPTPPVAKPVCNDGIGPAAVLTTTYSPNATNPVYSVTQGTCQDVKYSLITGGMTVTRTCTPQGIANGNQAGCTASAFYSASISPATISLVGPVQDTSGNYNILVGQGCTASLPSISTLTSLKATYQWSVTGTTFQDWEPTTASNPKASYFLGGSGPLTIATAKWYWNDPNQATETISCTATVTPPTGQGSPFSVTATKKVIVQLPTWKATGIGGYMQVNTKTPYDTDYEVWAGPTAAMLAHQPIQGGGMNWQAYVYTPTTPAFGTGSLEIVQIVTPNESWTLNTIPPQQQSSADNNIAELDGTCPYGNVTSTELVQPLLTNDTPGIPLTGRSPILSEAADKDSFIDYLMYLPPGSGSKWIALAQFTWSINGNATIPTTGNWADYVTQNHSDAAGTVNPGGTNPFTGVYGPNFFPSWTSVSP